MRLGELILILNVRVEGETETNTNIYIKHISTTFDLNRGWQELIEFLTSAHEDQGRNGISQKEVLQKVR